MISRFQRLRSETAVQQGGSLWSSLKFSTVVLLTASSLASIVLTGLATGALSSLGNFGMDKIFIMETEKNYVMIKHGKKL